MTDNAKECVFYIKSLGFNPMDFKKEHAANLQKLVAYRQKGECDAQFVRAHIHPNHPGLVQTALNEVEERMFISSKLREVGAGELEVQGVQSYPLNTTRREFFSMVTTYLCEKAGKHASNFSWKQEELIARLFVKKGMEAALKMCDPKIPEEELEKAYSS